MSTKTYQTILDQHPRDLPASAATYAETVAALQIANEVCTACGDACLAESRMLDELRRCIRLNLDCSEICALTARLLMRHTETDAELVHAQLHACVLALRACADECEGHQKMHRHCATCADACRHAQERCNRLLGQLSPDGVREEANDV